jgi:hypothetical protein
MGEISSILNTNIQKTLTITGIFILLTDFLYNCLFDKMAFGSNDIIVFLLGILCLFLGTVQFFRKIKRSELQGGFIIKDDFYENQISEKFKHDFPGINRIWGVKWFVRLMYKEGWWYSGLLLIILSISLGFMLNHLGQFMSVDEPKWFGARVPQLVDALLRFNWGLTYINDKPGILPAALSSIEFALNILSNFLLHIKVIQGPPELLLFFWRLPVVIFNIIMLIIIYSYLRDLINRDFSILCTSLIALNPIIIGISQIVNPDATLWSTGFVSFLAFFLYIKTNLRKYLIFSGFFLGLAFLSKYVAAILYLVFILAIIIEYLLDNNLKIEHISTRFYDFFTLVGISMIVYTIFFPATWVNPTQIFKGTVLASILVPSYIIVIPGLSVLFLDILVLKGRILHFIRQSNIFFHIIRLFILVAILFIGFLLYNLFFNYPFFDLNEKICCFQASDLSIIDILNTSVYVTIITITPLIFLMLSIFFINYSIKGSNFLKPIQPIESKILYTGIIFILFYILGASLGHYITWTRYQIILYPIYAIISTIIIISLIQKENILRLVTVLIIILNIFIVFQSSPFYLHYNNGLNVHNAVISDAWGLGGYEMAQKVNEFPDSRSLHIWSDREGFKEFFVGTYYRRGSTNPFENTDIKYLVLTNGGHKGLLNELRQYSKGKPVNSSIYPFSIETGNLLLKYYEKTPVVEIIINNNPNNYVRLVKLDEN